MLFHHQARTAGQERETGLSITNFNIYLMIKIFIKLY